MLQNGEAQLALVPLSPEEVAQETQAVIASRTIVTGKEARAIQGLCFCVWLFIFIFGIVEHTHDNHQSCYPGDPAPGEGQPEWLSVPKSTEACASCSPKNKIDCDRCVPGWYNLGAQCFKYLENLPPFTTGAALGGTTYFILIIATQCFGIFSEVGLIRRLMRRHLMPRKELIILGCALSIEIMRMFLVDVFVMREYFGGRSYSVFRVPVRCTDSSSTFDVPSWEGVDSQWYCDDASPHSTSTMYYVAASKDAWSPDTSVCTTWTSDSAVLAFGEKSSDMPGDGHTRFRTLGWVIGGEFALYYFFATFINEVADNIFVVPTTTSSGWLCKIFSVALEVFQLGALCPAAVFTHKECLHFTDPLGVPLEAMSTIVTVFGYFIWGFIFFSLPLAAGGAMLLFCLVALAQAIAVLALPLRIIAGRLPATWVRTRDTLAMIAENLQHIADTLMQRFDYLKKLMTRGCTGFIHGTMILAFMPMLCGGIFLGTLVVVGQASKKGAMQVLTAMVLLSDVLFKVVATIVTEAADYLRHHRVRTVVEEGTNRRVTGQVVGNSGGACHAAGGSRRHGKVQDDCQAVVPANGS